MKRNALLLVFWLLVFSGIASASHSTSHVFPQFADGKFADGTYYRTSIVIMNVVAPATTCNWTLYGMTTTLDTGETGSTFTWSFPNEATGNGVLYIRSTTGTQAFKSGYATISCNAAVAAQVIYGYYAANGTKLSEATVFSAVPNVGLLLPLDQREGAKLGVAVTNNTDAQHTYLVAFLPQGASQINGSFIVPARSSLARFVDEVMSIPANSRGLLIVESSDGSLFSAVGLRFTGSVFTTIPAFP